MNLELEEKNDESRNPFLFFLIFFLFFKKRGGGGQRMTGPFVDGHVPGLLPALSRLAEIGISKERTREEMPLISKT